MVRRSKRLERLEADRASRSFLNGFVIGFVFGQDEARREWARFGDEIEQRTDEVRGEIMTALRQLREQWGLPPEPPGDAPARKITVQ